jgi:hypothetical protein
MVVLRAICAKTRSRITAHMRGGGNHKHTTVPEHMPSSQRRYADRWHEIIGDPTYAEAILDRPSTTPAASKSPAKACAGPEESNPRKVDQPPSPMTQIHDLRARDRGRIIPLRRATSFRNPGRHHPVIPGRPRRNPHLRKERWRFGETCSKRAVYMDGLTLRFEARGGSDSKVANVLCCIRIAGISSSIRVLANWVPNADTDASAWRLKRAAVPCPHWNVV